MTPETQAIAAIICSERERYDKDKHFSRFDDGFKAGTLHTGGRIALRIADILPREDRVAFLEACGIAA